MWTETRKHVTGRDAIARACLGRNGKSLVEIFLREVELVETGKFWKYFTELKFSLTQQSLNVNYCLRF